MMSAGGIKLAAAAPLTHRLPSAAASPHRTCLPAKMNTMCLAYLGALLLVLFSSQVVQAQNSTSDPMNMTTAGNWSMTTASNESGCGPSAASLLLPLAAAASLLLGWSW